MGKGTEVPQTVPSGQTFFTRPLRGPDVSPQKPTTRDPTDTPRPPFRNFLSHFRDHVSGPMGSLEREWKVRSNMTRKGRRRGL